MKLESNIGWTDVTANAVIGCTRISPGCRECYAFRDTPARVLRSKGVETWGPSGVRHPVAGFEAKVRRLNKLCICDCCHEAQPVDRLEDKLEVCISCRARSELRPIRCFADSNSDWLDDRWPIETLTRFLKAIHGAPNVIFQLLTKRPENWKNQLHEVAMCGKHEPGDAEFHGWINQWIASNPIPQNIWLGVSCENQEWWDNRRELLLKIPAAQYFLSLEPLLGPLNLHLEAIGNGDKDAALRKKLWFIVGAESGPNYRPCQVEWITDIADQCKAAGIPVWVKQDSAKKPGQQGRIPDAYWSFKQTPH